MYLNRIKALLIEMKLANISNLLISDSASIAYLIAYHTSPGERLL